MSTDVLRFGAAGDVSPAAARPERIITGPSLSVDVSGNMFDGGSVFELKRGVRVVMCDRAYAPSRCALALEEGRCRLERSTAGCPGSKLSETLSFEVLVMLLDGAKLLKTEEEFQRTMHHGGSPVDYLLMLPAGGKVGCSVTRGFGYCNRRFSLDVAASLLRRKLAGLRKAFLHAADGDAFDARVLHVWVRSAADAQTLAAAADQLLGDDDSVAAADMRDTVLLISIASDALAGLF